jgi:cell division septum initiation protein DivIVA
MSLALEIVESEFVSKRVFTETYEKFHSERSSRRSTIIELCEQLSAYRRETHSSTAPIPTIQREIAVLKEDHHMANSLLNTEAAAAKNKLTALATALEICLYFKQSRIASRGKHRYTGCSSHSLVSQCP